MTQIIEFNYNNIEYKWNINDSNIYELKSYKLSFENKVLQLEFISNTICGLVISFISINYEMLEDNKVDKSEYIKNYLIDEMNNFINCKLNNKKQKFLDAMIDVGILKSWIPINNDNYLSFFKDINNNSFQEVYKGHNIFYEIKGKGLMKAIHFEITKIKAENKNLFLKVKRDI